MSSDSSKPKRHSHHSSSALSQSQLLPSRPDPSTQYPPATPTKQDQPSPTTSSPSTPFNEEDAPHDLPLSMSTSLLLASPTIPTDARSALVQLTKTLDPPDVKCKIRFHALPSAPELRQKVFSISASSKFGSVVAFLRKKLYGKAKEGEVAKGAGQGLFCYVNSVFAPGLDEGVGNLWRCFKVEGHLIVGYSITPAFG